MSEEVARWIAYSILAIASVAWLVAVYYVRGAWRLPTLPKPTEEQLIFDPGPAAKSEAGQGGEVRISGRPTQLSRRLAARLSQPGGPGTLGVLSVSQPAEDTVLAEQLEAMGFPFESCLVLFTADGADCVARYVIRSRPNRWLAVLAHGFLILGMGAIVGMGWLMEALVIPNPLPGVRWQVFQSLQVVHFLWPPFLLASLDRRYRRAVATRIEAMLSGLPFQDD